ncbi:MAG: DUF4157 domain-containing protein [Gemmatimonadaceae bacterium]
MRSTSLRTRRRSLLEPNVDDAPAPRRDSRVSTLHERLANPEAGLALPESTRGRLEQSFGHEFHHLRVHHDASADDMARTLDARAFAAGDHLFFRQGEYEPETNEGLTLVAHEAAHVASHEERSPASSAPDRIDVVAADDITERAAHDAAAAVIAGQSVSPSSESQNARPSQGDSGAVGGSLGGSVVVQRWPWDDDDPGVSAAAPSVANDITAPSLLSSIGGSIAGAAGSLYEGEKKSLNAQYEGVKSASNWWDKTANLEGFHKDFDTMGEGLKEGVGAASNWMDDSTKGNSTLNAIATGVGGTANDFASIGSGAIKGVGDLATGLGNTFLHPVDSAVGMASGMWNMWEHTPLIGGAFKGLHGTYDIATGNENGKYGNSFGELGENLAVGEQAQSDLDFWAGFGGGTQAWSDDPLDAGARTLTNFAPQILGIAEGVGSKGPGGAPPEAPVSAPKGGPVPEAPVPRPAAFTPEGAAAPEPLDIDAIARNNPDLVNRPGPGIGPRRPGQFFNDPIPLRQGPSELDAIRTVKADQQGGNAEIAEQNVKDPRPPKFRPRR